MSEFSYKPQYAVVVIAKDEADQKAIYEFLSSLGLTLKVVSV